MKLHLTKGLMMALIVAAGQVMAYEYDTPTVVTLSSGFNNENWLPATPGVYDISSLDWDTTSTQKGKIFLGYNNSSNITSTSDFGLYVAENETATVQGILAANSYVTATKLGLGTLNIAGYNSSDSGYSALSTPITVAEGTLKISTEKYVYFSNGSTTEVQSGATLEIAADQTLGDTNYTNGDLESKIHLAGGATLSGDSTITFSDGQITASGTNNVVSATLKSSWNINLNVDADGELTISGAVEDGGSDNVKKTGAGTLIFSNTATIDDALTLYVEAGALDLSEVSTFTAGLDLANNTTLILDGTPVSLSGALTMGSGITIDLGDTAMTYGMTIFTSTSTFSDALDGLQVAIKAANGYVQPAGYIVLSEDKTAMKLIPEPATATLSLLALAGLAARRRRK